MEFSFSLVAQVGPEYLPTVHINFLLMCFVAPIKSCTLERQFC